MATDINEITRNTKQGWDGFCRFFSLLTVSVIITLVLMAIFLL